MSSGGTTTDYGRPYRPAVVRLANALGRALGPGIPRLRPGALIDRARRRAGLHRIGEGWWTTALEHQLRSIEDEARLTTVGRVLQHERIVGSLVQRLRAQALLAAHPEIADVGLEPPIVIVGLQRTGTTLLQRCLAIDPRLRSLATHEALTPLVAAAGRPASLRTRVLAARRAESAIRLLAPHLFAVHPMEARAPEEDVVLLEHGFASQTAEATMHVPTFSAWLEGQDLREAYGELRRWLQVLCWRREPRRWLLKSPNHLEHLDVLLETFPGAMLVRTRRDPAVATASFFSMVAHARGLFSDRVDPEQIGRHWLRKIGRMLARSRAAMAARGVEPVEVDYAELVGDPVASVARVLARAGLEPAEPLAALCGVGGARGAAGPRHVHRLEDFGLAPADVAAAWAGPGAAAMDEKW